MTGTKNGSAKLVIESSSFRTWRGHSP